MSSKTVRAKGRQLAMISPGRLAVLIGRVRYFLNHTPYWSHSVHSTRVNHSSPSPCLYGGTETTETAILPHSGTLRVFFSTVPTG